MNRLKATLSGCLAVASVVLIVTTVEAYPPAPPAIVFGMVRDQLGNPLQNSSANVVFSTASGSNSFSTTILPNMPAGQNYYLALPMDSGISGASYSPTALMPAAAFRLQVRIGTALYVPIEMQGNLAKVGAPGSRSRIDLTLGVSSGNDGLPDAWKQAIIQQLGLSLTPNQIHPGDMAPGTGLTYYQIYVAGTYFLLPANGFELTMSGTDGSSAAFSFTSVKGRTYTVQAGAGLDSWTTAGFSVVQGGVTNAPINSFTATNTAVVNISVPPVSGSTQPAQFYRLLVQ
jgi:hypothetical protein